MWVEQQSNKHKRYKAMGNKGLHEGATCVDLNNNCLFEAANTTVEPVLGVSSKDLTDYINSKETIPFSHAEVIYEINEVYEDALKHFLPGDFRIERTYLNTLNTSNPFEFKAMHTYMSVDLAVEVIERKMEHSLQERRDNCGEYKHPKNLFVIE